MATVTVSSKYQIVIPKSVRKMIEVNIGQKFQIIPHNDRLELIPVKKMAEMRGFLSGIDTTVKRESENHQQKINALKTAMNDKLFLDDLKEVTNSIDTK